MSRCSFPVSKKERKEERTSHVGSKKRRYAWCDVSECEERKERKERKKKREFWELKRTQHQEAFVRIRKRHSYVVASPKEEEEEEEEENKLSIWQTLCENCDCKS